MNGVEGAIALIAEEQFGVFSREQAAAAGMSEESMSRRVMGNSWERMLPSVYRLPGATRTGRQRAMAAVLWAGPTSAISHTTAARLLRLDSVRSRELHLTVPTNLGVRDDRVEVHHARSLPRGDLVAVDGIRCTSASRTIIDCAALLDDETLETAFEQARRMGLTSVSALARRAGELCGPGRPGSSRVRRLLAVQAAGEHALESRLEVKLARLLRNRALPAPVRQHPVGRFRLDFAWPALRVACECDGFEHHGARLAWKRDRRRLAAIEAAGWRIVHVTWDDVTCAASQTLDRLERAVREAA
jgi:very-short-patch-repair endonuclease